MTGRVADELSRHFQARGVEICCVEECGQFGRVLSESPAADAVLTQVSLPDGNWRDVIEQVRRASAQPPVIVLAPQVSSQLWWDALDCGAIDTVKEPRTASEFASLVDLIREAGSGPG